MWVKNEIKECESKICGKKNVWEKNEIKECESKICQSKKNVRVKKNRSKKCE